MKRRAKTNPLISDCELNPLFSHTLRCAALLRVPFSVSFDLLVPIFLHAHSSLSGIPRDPILPVHQKKKKIWVRLQEQKKKKKRNKGGGGKVKYLSSRWSISLIVQPQIP